MFLKWILIVIAPLLIVVWAVTPIIDAKTLFYYQQKPNKAHNESNNTNLLYPEYQTATLQQNRKHTHAKQTSQKPTYDQISVVNNCTQQTSFLLVNSDRIYSIQQHNLTYYLGNRKSYDLWFSPNTKRAISTDFKPYGKHTVLKNSSANHFGYDHDYQDHNTGLLYLRARNYNPISQHFMTMDSYNTWNKYNFADANPIMNVDQNGHESKKSSFADILLYRTIDMVEIVAGAGSALYKAATLRPLFKYTGWTLMIAGSVDWIDKTKKDFSKLHQYQSPHQSLAFAVTFYFLDAFIIAALATNWMPMPAGSDLIP